MAATWRTTDATTHTINVLLGTYRSFIFPARVAELPILPSTVLDSPASALQHTGRGRKFAAFEAYTTSIGGYNTLAGHYVQAHAGSFKDGYGTSEGCIISQMTEPEWLPVRPVGSRIRFGITLLEATTS